MNTVSIAAKEYCEHIGRIPKPMITGQIMTASRCTDAEADIAMHEVESAVRFAIGEIHKTYFSNAGTEEPARSAFLARYPEIEEKAALELFKYASWCVAKGA